ncbi:hypothetical protein M0802_007209 [Mischocyttarus mexicanus]|nr:hypothetical protein M0802_007209 [Mischocyttarus mexicanus]
MKVARKKRVVVVAVVVVVVVVVHRKGQVGDDDGPNWTEVRVGQIHRRVRPVDRQRRAVAMVAAVVASSAGPSATSTRNP